MFNEQYKKAMDDIKPDELLVQKTKNLMHKELKKKPNKIYKYATVAACLIITFSLFRVTFNSSSNVSVENAMIGNSDNMLKDTVSDSSFYSYNALPSSGNFIVSGGASFSAKESVLESENVFVRFIKGVVEWFEKLIR